ncbi:hypothetical protein [Streptomyces umbrinus]|uniref:hypothetical protein n=1 Tax=Streptomyces umbrinus TaxID=67370 RepID=UPI0033F0EABD
MTRYLYGVRIAPQEFIEDAADFVAEHGHPLSDKLLETLHTLRRRAEKVGSTEAKLRHANEEIERLNNVIAEMDAIRQRSDNVYIEEIFEEWHKDAAEELKDLERQLQEIAEELTQERQRVQQLEARIRAQEALLSDANDLVCEMRAELDRKEDELRQSRKEIKVLRRRLGEEGPVSEVSTQASEVVATPRSAVRDSTVQGKSAQRNGSRSAQGGKAEAESPPAQTSSAQSDPASPDPTSTAAPQRSFTGSLFAALSVLSALFVPVFLYLNFAAFAAACFSKDGPPWWGLVMLALANFFFTVAGLLLLMGLSRATAKIAAPQGKKWSWGYPGIAIPFGELASVVSLISGIKLLVDGDVTDRGLQWLHMFGISG